MKYRSAITLISILICSGLGAQVQNGDSVRILPAQPINFGADIEKDSWASALIDKQIRFRLEPLAEIHAMSINEIAGFLPSISKMDAQISESSYHNVAVKANAGYILFSRFELTKEKTVHYYFELVPVKSSQKSIIFEQTYPFEKFSSGLDSCILGLLNNAGIRLKAESSRFFQIPVLSSNLKNIRLLGEIIYSENSSKRPADDLLIKDYESVIGKDPYLIVGKYCCGLLCYNSKRYDKAAICIRELIEITSIHRSLYLPLAKSYRLSARFQEALNTAQQGLQMNVSPSIDFLSEKALDLEALGQKGPAASIHTQILSLDKNSKYSLLFLAKQKNEAADFKYAGLYALHLVRIDSTNGSGWFELGRSLYGQGTCDKALLALLKAEKFIPKDPSVQEWLGDLYLRKQDNKEASLHFKKAAEAAPDKAGLFIKAADALSLDKRSSEALTLLKSVESRFSKNDQFCKTIGLLEYNAGNYQRASSFLSGFLKSQPNDPDALSAMGRIYSKDGKDDMALDMFNRALPVSVDKQSCRMEIASIYIKKKDQSAAQRILSEVIAQKPVKGAYALMGDALMIGGNSKGALLNYEKERELHGAEPSVQEKICMIHFEKGSLVPAKAEFQKLLQIDSDNPTVRYYLSIIALKNRDPKSAGQYLAEASKYGKGNASIFLMIGNCYTAIKLNDKAIPYYQNCIAFDSRNEEAVMKLGEALDETGQDSAAAEYFIKLFSLQNVKYSAYLARAGHLFNSLKLSDKASRAYALFIEKGNSDFSVNAAYAQLQYANKKYSSVVDLLKNINGNWAKDKQLLLVLADSYCRISQYAPALPLLSSILDGDSKNKKAIELSAIAYEKTGDARNAILMYEKYLQFSPDNNFKDYSYHLAGLYETNSMAEKAISRYESNIKMNPDDLRNHEHLALLYIKQKKWEQAEKVLKAAVEFPQASPGLLKMLAQTLTTQSKNVEASEVYSQYLVKVKTDSLAWKELGRLYFAQAQYSQAIRPLQRASEFLPNDFDILYMLGKSYVGTANMSKAIAPLSRAQTLNGQSIAVLELLVRAYRELNEKSSLKASLLKWAGLDPKRFDIRLELGSIYLDEKRIDDAIKVLFEAVRFIPTEYKPHILLAKAYELKANDTLRLRQLNEAQHLANDNWEVHFELARYFISKDQRTEAEQHLKKSLELNTFNGRAHYEYGTILLGKGEYEKAYDELQQAVETETGKVHYVAEFAYASCMVNKRNNGLEMIKSALYTAPDDPEVLYWAGLIYKATDQRDLAKETLRKAISQSPDYARCYEGLGDIYLEEVSYKSAADYYFKAWEKGGYNENRACKLATALAYDYKFDEAKGFLETVITRNPGNERALYNLISVCCELGDVKNARKSLKMFKNNSEWMQLSQGKIYETEGNLNAAWIAYKVVMKLSPSNPNVHAGFGRLMLKQKEYDSAVVYISNAAATDSLNMELQLLQGQAFEGMGDLKSAYQLYSEVEARYHEHGKVYALLASIRSKEGNHPEAIKILEKGIRFCPKDYDLYYQIGHQLELTDQYEPAIEAYQTALKKGRGTPIEALRNIGNIYYDKLVNSKKAKEFYKKYLKAGGKDEEVAIAMKKLEN